MQHWQLLRLKRGEERRLVAGHLWVFSNEVDTQASPLSSFAPGSEVQVVDYRGRTLGFGTINPKSLICVRLHARTPRLLDETLVEERLADALSLRLSLFEQPFFRLAHGEGDFLPGLVVDRFDSHLTVQVTTLAMEQRRDMVRSALHKLLAPKSILWDNSVSLRALEGLETESECEGDVPENLQIPESGCLFRTSLTEGQKTGWYYDQRPNRALMQRFANGRKVLDAFCYVGGFGVNAAFAGASSVTLADASARALEQARANCLANAASCSCRTLQGDAFETLKALARAGERFDVVSVDPPAFIKRRRDFKEGLAAYRRINALALSLLDRGGVLFTSSCSQLLETAMLRSVVAVEAARLGLHARILHAGFQGPDHPVHCSMPETAYLKCLVCQITGRDSAPNLTEH